MKKIILLILLFILIAMLLFVSYIKFFYSPSNSMMNTSKNRSEYNSYYLKRYRNDGALLQEGTAYNYYLEINDNNKKVTLCMTDISNCFSYTYNKKGNKYENVSDTPVFLDGNFEIEKAKNEENDDIIVGNITYYSLDNEKITILFKKK